MVEQTGSSFRNYIFEKALEASITCNLLGICIVRMIPKPSKNGSAFCQKTIKIQAWRHQDRGLEGSGAGLEASWAILGHPGRLWKRLGPSWKRLGSVLEASWAVLGRKSWPTWLQDGSQNGGQIYKKQSKNRSLVGCHLESPFVGFPPIFGIKNRAMLVRKCIQKSIRS